MNNDKLNPFEQFFIYEYKGKITISDSGREISEIHMYTLHLTPKLLYLIIAV